MYIKRYKKEMFGAWMRADSGYLSLQKKTSPPVPPISPTGTVRVNIIAPSEPASWFSDVVTKITAAKNANWPSTTLTITQNHFCTQILLLFLQVIKTCHLHR